MSPAAMRDIPLAGGASLDSACRIGHAGRRPARESRAAGYCGPPWPAMPGLTLTRR